MPLIDYNGLKSTVTMQQVLNLLHFRRVRTAGGWQRGACPIHQPGRRDSDVFAAHSGGWRCHSCGRRGDVLRLWAEATGQPLYLATMRLCELLGIDPPLLRPGQKPTQGWSSGRRRD